MSLLIVSDMHIWGPEDPLYTSLIALVRRRAGPGDTVVLAGDLFDLFVGNKRIFKQRYSAFFSALSEAASRGVQCHYVEGNHDFLLHKALGRLPGVSIHSHDVTLEIGGKKFYFAHGDTVVSTDYGYRFLRAFLRSPLMKAFVFLMPGSWIQKIGEKSSYQSRKRKPLLPTQFPLKEIERLRRSFRSFAAERLAQGCDFVVMGHCHDLDEMMFKIDGRQGQYVNVGYPRVHGSYLSWCPGESKIERERLP